MRLIISQARIQSAISTRCIYLPWESQISILGCDHLSITTTASLRFHFVHRMLVLRVYKLLPFGLVTLSFTRTFIDLTRTIHYHRTCSCFLGVISIHPSLYSLHFIIVSSSTITYQRKPIHTTFRTPHAYPSVGWTRRRVSLSKTQSSFIPLTSPILTILSTTTQHHYYGLPTIQVQQDPWKYVGHHGQWQAMALRCLSRLKGTSTIPCEQGISLDHSGLRPRSTHACMAHGARSTRVRAFTRLSQGRKH